MSLDGINLLPPELLTRRKSHNKYLLFVAAGVAAAIVMAMTYMAVDSQVVAEQARLDQMNARVTQLKQTVATYKSYQEDEEALSKQEGLVQGIKSTETRWSEVLDDVSLIIPSGVQLDEFSADAATVPPTFVLKGRSKNFAGIADFIVRLQNSQRFADVVLEQTGVTEGSPIISFTLKAKVAPPGSVQPSGG